MEDASAQETSAHASATMDGEAHHVVCLLALRTALVTETATMANASARQVILEQTAQHPVALTLALSTESASTTPAFAMMDTPALIARCVLAPTTAAEMVIAMTEFATASQAGPAFSAHCLAAPTTAWATAGAIREHVAATLAFLDPTALTAAALTDALDMVLATPTLLANAMRASLDSTARSRCVLETARTTAFAAMVRASATRVSTVTLASL